MKFKTTKKEVMSGYPVVICVGYCSLQSLLSCKRETAYTTRREGWAADVFEVSPSVAIVTGYAPFGNVRPDYSITRRYEEDALRVCSNVFNWDERERQLDGLLKNFVKEATKNDL